MGVRVKPDKHKPGRWWVRINHRGRRKSLAFSSKKAADVAAVKIDAALKLGQLDVLEPQVTPAPVPTFKEYAEKWLEGAAVRLKPSTLEQYRSRLKRILPTLGHLPLTRITRQTIRELIGAMIVVGNRRSPGKPIARGTVREALRAVSAILATAAEDELIPANPCSRMGRQIGHTGTQVEEVEVFSREELTRLLRAAEKDWPEWHPFLLCLARTGLRLGEAIALEWQDVDFAQQVLHVRRSRRHNRVSVPKSGKARRVDMSPQLTAVLRARKSLVEAEAALCGQPVPGSVFTHRGEPVSEDFFRVRVWAPLLRRAELRYRKPHTVRHTFASLLIEGGESLPYVQAQLGHHSAAFTLKVYGHLLPRGDRRGVDTLDHPQSPRNLTLIPGGAGQPIRPVAHEPVIASA